MASSRIKQSRNALRRTSTHQPTLHFILTLIIIQTPTPETRSRRLFLPRHRLLLPRRHVRSVHPSPHPIIFPHTYKSFTQRATTSTSPSTPNDSQATPESQPKESGLQSTERTVSVSPRVKSHVNPIAWLIPTRKRYV